MKKDLSPGSDPECHTLLKAIHERIAHSSLCSIEMDVNARDLLGIVMDFMADV